MIQASQELLSADSVKPTGARTPADALGEPKRMSPLAPSSQESDVECPTCAETFGTKRGVKLHHARTHNESLAFSTVSCAHCGETFERRSVKVEAYETNYCTAECQAEAYSKTQTIECDNCGGDVERQPARTEGMNFCSNKCHGEWLSENALRENARNWDGGLDESACERCGEQFTHREYQTARFCSNDCFHAHLSDTAKEDTPYYGANWSEQRQRALERDGHQCVICGRDDIVDVHHIRPFREYGVENHKQANQLTNLVTLCRSHHSEWEGIPLRPEVSDE